MAFPETCVCWLIILSLRGIRLAALSASVRLMMQPSFTIDLLADDDVSYVRLSGVIDEHNALASYSERVTGSVAVINLSGISRINSCGVRDWVLWLTELEKRGIAVYLDECAPPMVLQMGQVKNFVGHAKVLSVLCPYYCEPPCETERLRLLTHAEATIAQPPQAPKVNCDRCGRDMEFDEYEAQYLGWFEYNKLSKIPPAVERAVRKLSRPDETLRDRQVPAGSYEAQAPAAARSTAAEPPVAEGRESVHNSAVSAAPSRVESPRADEGRKPTFLKTAVAATALVGAIALLIYALFH